MSNQHRYEQRRSQKHRGFTVATVLVSICALCIAVIFALIVLHQNADATKRTQAAVRQVQIVAAKLKTTVQQQQDMNNHKWCALLGLIKAPPQNLPTSPYGKKINDATTKLFNDYKCGR